MEGGNPSVSSLCNGQNMKMNVFIEIKPEDMKCLRVLFHKQKHD